MDFVKWHQHFLPVPTDKGYVSQHFVVLENGVELLNTQVGFDPTTGNEPAEDQLPSVWVEVGATVEQRLTYVDSTGNETDPFVLVGTQLDEFAGPGPGGLGTTHQVDQRTADARPTD